MIDYRFAYRYIEIKEDPSIELILYVKDSIINTIENMFKSQTENDKTLLNIVLRNNCLNISECQ